MPSWKSLNVITGVLEQKNARDCNKTRRTGGRAQGHVVELQTQRDMFEQELAKISAENVANHSEPLLKRSAAAIASQEAEARSNLVSELNSARSELSDTEVSQQSLQRDLNTSKIELANAHAAMEKLRQKMDIETDKYRADLAALLLSMNLRKCS